MASPEHAAYEQAVFDIEPDPLPEIMLEEFTVSRRPTMTKLATGQQEWRCTFHKYPDIFNPDRNELVYATTILHAADAKGMSLRKNEQVTITGTLVQKQEIALVSGDSQTIYHVLVTNLVVPQRPHESIPTTNPLPSPEHLF